MLRICSQFATKLLLIFFYFKADPKYLYKIRFFKVNGFVFKCLQSSVAKCFCTFTEAMFT